MFKLFLATLVSLAPLAASAEIEVSLFSGVQESPHSKVTGTLADSTPFDFTAGWEGRSFDMPPYYGIRATWWRTETFGWGLEFTHDKVYADDQTLADNALDVLEFSDGLNIVTVNATKRWPEQWGRVTPYVGGGVGLSIPHVEITPTGGARTFEYQVTGPAVRWFGGVKYDLNDRFALFGEYQGTYSINDAKMDGGGTLSTNIITTALNLGVSYSF